MYYVYAIKNAQRDKIYIGQTKNLEKRLKRHNRQLPSKTKSYTYKNAGEWELFYKETLPTRKGALKREKELKSYRGREYIKKLLKGP